jgi:hypothetical protein
VTLGLNHFVKQLKHTFRNELSDANFYFRICIIDCCLRKRVALSPKRVETSFLKQ